MASFNVIYLFILLSFINFVTTKSYGNPSFSYSCSLSPKNKTTPNSVFHLNLRTLLSYLSSNATTKQFYNTSVTSKSHFDAVYGIFMCWGDVTPELCTQCVSNATKAILIPASPEGDDDNCLLSKEARFFNEVCMIRFSNHFFFSIVDLGSPESECIYNNQENYTSLVYKAINETADDAARYKSDHHSPIGAKKYATKETRIDGFQTLYCEAQCTPDLSPQDCSKCLNIVTISHGQGSCRGLSGSFRNPSCKIKYDVYPFYRPSITPAPSELVPIKNSSSTKPKHSQHNAYLSHHCSKNNTFSNTLASNVRSLLSSMSSYDTTKNGFFKTTINTVSGLFMCRGNLSATLCHICVLNATQFISSECPFSQEAIIWYNYCFLRYSKGPSLSTNDTTPVYHDLTIVSTSNPNLQQRFLSWTLANILYEMQYKPDESTIKNYGTKAVKLNDHQTLHTLVQCTPDLSYSDCDSCLHNIVQKEIPWYFLASLEGKVMFPSCYIMFGLSQFYDNDNEVEASEHTPPSPANTENNKHRARTTIILIVVLIMVLVVLFFFCCYLRRRETRKNNCKTLLKKNFGHESITLEGLQFDLLVIKAATNNFSNKNRIGKGGFGEVYKGILCDGRHIAVKRLSTSSKQGSTEFKNEILLIAKLQHRNLVTFIGFCLEDQEKILIYEYMPNGSLDYHLFDIEHQKLSWLERYKIIKGTAIGILYLHEYSRLKVIHRDLKPSNVLLDENMNPKISDFGLAKIVEMDQDCGNTNKIAGTFGYMPPEYAMLGQFSDKSDVFSFGVMVLEIMTGKRNVNVYESRNVVEGLMGYVWRQWKNQEPLNILDSNIKTSYSQMEVLKCIHVSLLCVQENPNARPTMAMVISYLNNDSLELPSPQEPAFFLHRSRMDREIVIQQELSLTQANNGSTPFSTNEMSTTDFYPR
ncbi:hypothetical protein VNO78_06703 [Psophocarpus tetragonolobus]|uniref:Cysteine-rich receptor-kinase-like protein n=1 Tax=Psophocarpus tetragonolobus TaxID=3891 RepID=A0AAN9T1X7_PSOTE